MTTRRDVIAAAALLAPLSLALKAAWADEGAKEVFGRKMKIWSSILAWPIGQ